MPLYEYQCEQCGEQFEKIQKFSDPPLETCPKCGGGPIHKLISAPAFHLKGTGWYLTDYARKDSGGGKAEGSKDAGSKDAGSKDAGGGTDNSADAPKKDDGKNAGTKEEKASNPGAGKGDSTSTGGGSSDATPKKTA